MKRKIWIRVLIVLMAIMLALAFYRLPYYVEKPGMAHELKSLVQVENGYHDKGKLMLTTVRMGRANIYDFALAKIRKFEEIVPLTDVRDEKQTEEEYNVYQLYLMESSKNNAIQVAYKKAKKSFHSIYKGVYVLSVYPNMPAAKVLKPGDRITKIDGKSFESSEQFINYVQKKQAGDQINISFVRDNSEKTSSIQLAKFDDAKGKIGMGIGLVDDRDLISDPVVKLNTEEIGGPSAGLMFSLEIYNQLTKNDITKGYSIAGTGTIDPDGTVGRIGGIDKKVVAADKEGAQIFFAPDDEITPEMKKAYPNIQSNYKEALKAAKELGTKMKIIPVKTFDDALAYLSTLT
ncbi:SepM family pheromone-processing serine protease [Heyndrickxia sp. NPDC080065]|uniref:SepM family pheromone-processing serine protease n=1 Tax=Heyndrickxia sp. NPDC080065 TaxID=3390568 RepID=UPI003D078DE4